MFIYAIMYLICFVYVVFVLFVLYHIVTVKSSVFITFLSPMLWVMGETSQDSLGSLLPLLFSL